MSLFQKSVLSKYIKGIDEDAVKTQWQAFKQHFHNATIQQNIRNSKEEQYQEGFLDDLFVKVLGYTKNPEPNFNLTTELKNINNAKKTDGAIIIEGKTIAVIELKGTNTTDLSKAEGQAFNYKNNQPDAVYVITANFEKLRFYIDNAVDFIEFNLFQLTIEDFKLMYLCLAHQNLSKGLAQQIKNESLFNEENITKQLYKDYSTFKNELFTSIQKDNPEYDKLTLYKKTQKLLDRFLFIFFAEDRLLLPPNSIRAILKQWEQLKDLDAYTPLYSRYKKYFGYMNTGHKGKQHDIFAYNGGLFAADEILDNITIADEVLATHTQNLSHNDFESEVSVNILGHIFEHSLNEIEAITAELEGKAIDTKKTKRKKDGVFYTPKYITKYIVENTVGKLCTEKKTELQIEEADYAKERKGRKKETLKKLQQQLESYRKWLLGLTICDPACGSGAFLNQALEFLITEHRYIDELQAKLLNEPMVFSDIENAILENNLFGVDINEESVDIAKLSLWLRTAQKGRKLTTLSSNIKCGNSLIDDPAIAGTKAFNWQNEFPQVFKNGGFDVVIGNPPYVRAELLTSFREYFEKEYSVYIPAGDLFSYFYEQSFNLLKIETGIFGFISNTFDKTTAGIALRNHLQNNVCFDKYIDFTEVQIFEGATTYPIILTAINQKPKNLEFDYIKIPKKKQGKTININTFNIVKVQQEFLKEDNWSFKSREAVQLLKRITSNKTVKEIYGKSYRGLLTGLNDAFIISKQYNECEHIKPIYEGKEIKKWNTPESVQQLILYPSKWTKQMYGDDITEDKAIEFLKNENPTLINHIIPFEERAKKRHDKGDFFWELRNCAYYGLLEKPKIIFPNLQNSNKFCYDETGAYINAPSVILPTNDKFLVAILNSKIVWYFLTNICVVRSGGYIEVKPQYFEQIPIPKVNETKGLEALTNKQIEASNKFQKKSTKFIGRIKDNLGLENISKKLQSFYEYDFKTFLAELKKKKIKLNLSQQDEWEDYFNDYKNQLTELQHQINQTDTQIDQIVYQLYGLTDEEIKIVEASV